ncbi:MULTISPECIES: hypothetical protein [Geomicrobium]|uniref:DNA-binding transcriptional regulator YafY n=1 Tax=Geomicrobium sediminis TaxID=1347788 RepID=A0ABS2PF44_9BACL|nr:MULTISPECIES: hypothetical protein [Geomicrobium]MBM7633685.1 putative DNA-binding transcriptional regulator YafY [Geomicrobium sediminis]
MQTILETSCVKRQKLCMIYKSEGGNFTKRVVRIQTYDDRLINAWCFKSQAYRRFLRKNILAIEPVNTYG